MVRLTPTRLLCAAILLCTFFLASSVFNLLFGERGYDLLLERPPPARAHPGTADVHFGTECSPFTAGVMDDVTIVLKMGAGEAQTELPTYLNRLGRCKQDLLLFSDRKTIYNGFDIVDALGNIRPEYKYRNLDFDIYDRIQTANTTEEISHEGYKLDKYKLLPMMELATHLRPQSRWFIFLDMDTYVNWDNLYRFLTAFNPQLPYYFGSPMWPKKKTVYAHGGSGFILSRGAMNKLMARGRMFAENHHFPGTHFFGEDLTKQTYGDEVLAQVLKKSGVPIRGYWPMFNGEKPISVRFGNEQWCEAILTMHHLQEDDFTSLAHWEASRSHPNRPLTFEELFTFIEPQIREKVDDWSNISDDVTYKKGNRAARSFQDCANACLKDSKCMQYEHAGDTCRLSHTIRLGRHQDPDGDKKWTSGWMIGRIKKFKAARSPCQGAHFVHSNP